MTVRTARGDETRREILAAAADLFHKQGVVATSPDQIIDASGTGKGQFYHFERRPYLLSAAGGAALVLLYLAAADTHAGLGTDTINIGEALQDPFRT